MTEKGNPMNISPTEAEEALEAVQKITQKTRQSIASSGVYVTLIVTGIVWLIGFAATQFMSGETLIYLWVGLSIIASILGTIMGFRRGRRVRSPAFNEPAKRGVTFWILLIFFAIAAIAIARPTDGKQVTMFIILFTMIGQLAMGLLLSFSVTWWAVPVMALALIGYFLLPGYFYLWMAVLGGGGMIAFGLYIRSRW
jgi:hypothetical protein